MIIEGQKFIVTDTFDTVQFVPDSFVLGGSKIGSGHGEAKFYITSKTRMRDFYGDEGFNVKCFINSHTS